VQVFDIVLIKEAVSVLAVLEVFLAPLYKLVNVLHPFSGLLLGGISLLGREVSVEAVVCEQGEECEGEGRDVGLGKLCFRVGKQAISDILELEPVRLHWLQIHFGIDLLSKVARGVFQQCELKVDLLVGKFGEPFKAESKLAAVVKFYFLV